MTLYSESGRLFPTPPFDLAQSLRFLGLFKPSQGEQSVAAQSLTKAIVMGGRAIAFRVEAEGTAEKPEVAYSLYSEQPPPAESGRAAAERIAFFLSLDDDLKPFYAIGQADPAFALVIEQLYGYHQVKFLTPFENACWAILSQRTQLPVARKAKDALTARFGRAIELEGTSYAAFPEPAEIAAADPAAIAAAVGNERQASYLPGVARAFRDGDEMFLRTAPYEEANAWLQQIKGIGAWSAAFILLRGLGRMEHASLDEVKLLSAGRRVYGPEQTAESLQLIAERYGRWQGYWAHYLRAAG